MFYDSLEKRNALLDYKKKKLKNRKYGIFLKGLVHGFGQKLIIFPDFYFKDNRSENCVLRYCRRRRRNWKKSFSRL